MIPRIRGPPTPVRWAAGVVHIAETNEVASETSSVLLPFVGIKIAPTTTLGTFRLGPWLQGRTDIGRPEIDTDASDGAKTTGGGTFVAGGLTVGAALDG